MGAGLVLGVGGSIAVYFFFEEPTICVMYYHFFRKFQSVKEVAMRDGKIRCLSKSGE